MLLTVGMGYFKEVDMRVDVDCVSEGEVGFCSSRHDTANKSAQCSCVG